VLAFAFGLIGLARGGGVRAPLVALALAVLVAGPVAGGHLLGSNQNPRFMAPAMPALGVGLAALLALASSRALAVLVALLLLAQAAAVAAFIRDPADWAGPAPLRGLSALSGRYNPMCRYDPIRERLDAAGARAPRLGFFGTELGFNHVQIAWAWHRAGRSIEAVPLHEGLRDWPAMLDRAAGLDAVLVLDSERVRRREREPFRTPDERDPDTSGALAALAGDARFRAAGAFTLGSVPPCHARLFLVTR
jgi:hypothetical protein